MFFLCGRPYPTSPTNLTTALAPLALLTPPALPGPLALQDVALALALAMAQDLGPALRR